MTSNMETPLTKLVNAEKYNSSIHMGGLRTRDLPEPDYRSTYALELSFLIGCWIFIDYFKIKGLSKFRKNAVWESLVAPLHLALGIGWTTYHANQKTIFSQRNAEYLKNALHNKHAIFGSAVILPDSPSPDKGNPGAMKLPESYWVAVHSLEMTDSAVKSANLTYGEGDELYRMTVMLQCSTSALASVRGLLSRAGVDDDMFEPLRITPGTRTLKSTSEKLPPPPTNEAPQRKPDLFEGLSDAGSAESQYEEWVRYCKDAAELQGIPERLIIDLIPPREIANHSVRDIATLEDFLERGFPGRRQWLLNEGVTKKDFDTYWGYPSWVRNFIEALMEQTFRFQYQSRLKAGDSHDLAICDAALFIPTYGVSPGKSESIFEPLPIELFERVRRHMSSLTDEQYCGICVSNKLECANQYIRMKIKLGEI